MLFLAGNTNKALCSAATLAVLKALDAITSRCRRPKLRDLKNATEEATEIWKANPQKKHAFGNVSIRVRPTFIIGGTVYISWLFRMSAKCVGNLGRPCVYKAPNKNIATLFHPIQAARHVFWIFHKWGQMNLNYGKSSIMALRRKMLGYILWKLGNLEGELRSDQKTV